MDAVLTSLLNQGSAWVAGGTVPGRLGNRHPSIVPYETYDGADRPFAVAVGNDRQFARLCTVIGLDELPGDPDFATNQARVANVVAHSGRLQAVFAAAPAERWVDALRAAGVPAGIINRVDEAWTLAEDLGMEPIARPDGVPVAAPPLRLDGERPAVARRPPRLDEHGDEIRAWLREA
jgi:crotonobetainyl-CoA:carnitine CoA-transferase CaiB-like acyl-CoA transferase